MKDDAGRKVWTYVPEDGSPAVEAWNPHPGAYIPDSIDLPDGSQAHLDQASGVAKAANFSPGVGVRTVVPWTPPPPDPSKPVQVTIGWPGMTEVTDV